MNESQRQSFPQTVADKLRAHNAVIERLVQERQTYIAAVFDTLGITGELEVNLDDMTYGPKEAQNPN